MSGPFFLWLLTCPIPPTSTHSRIRRERNWPLPRFDFFYDDMTRISDHYVFHTGRQALVQQLAGHEFILFHTHATTHPAPDSLLPKHIVMEYSERDRWQSDLMGKLTG